MGKHKINWYDMTFNPVIGCLNDCEYCYARKLARRFWKKIWEKECKLYQYKSPVLLCELKEFNPIFLNSNFNKPFPRKTSKIFVNSMSEIKFWEKEWMEVVFKKIKKYPQHTFLFLTKFPEVYYDYVFPENCWLGITETGETQDKLDYFYELTLNKKNKFFISFEPLLSPIKNDFSTADWIIIGSQTNPLKLPKREWVAEIIKEARKNEIPVFVKENLWKYYPELRIQEFPKGKREVKNDESI